MVSLQFEKELNLEHKETTGRLIGGWVGRGGLNAPRRTHEFVLQFNDSIYILINFFCSILKNY